MTNKEFYPLVSAMLGVLFITLKLTGFINWSWWWVLAPLWIMWGLSLAWFAVIVVISVHGLNVAKKLQKQDSEFWFREMGDKDGIHRL